MSIGKDMIVLLIVGLIKKTLHKMSQHFPSYRAFVGNAKVELDLSNYDTNTGLKNVAHIDISNFALKSNLANLKTEVDKIDL